MGIDCFVAGVYGIYVDEETYPEHIEKLNQLFEFPEDSEEAAHIAIGDDYELGLYAPERLIDFEKINQELLTLHGFSETSGLGLQFTYDAGDVPGRCVAEPNSWMLGFGLYAFPLEVTESTAETLKILKDAGAAWETWATLG